MFSLTIQLKKLLKQKKLLLKSLGAFAVTALVVAFTAPSLSKVVIAVSSTQKKLPIYSVETPDKKISISFDAAWGEVK